MSTLVGKNLKNSTEYSLHELVHEISINDENWRCIVTMLVETSGSQIKYTSMLNEACDNGYRKAIYLISRENMLATIYAPTRNDSPHTADPSPSLQRIRQCALSALQSLASSDESATTASLPPELEAALIKWMIYEARLESLARGSAELEEAAVRDQEFLTAMPQESRRGGKKSTLGKQPTGELKRVGSARRANSRLRRRGEEWRDRVYIDDAPLDGPNLYILLTGFRDPGLPLELINIGVPLNYILKLENLQSKDDEFEVVSSSSTVPSSKSTRCTSTFEELNSLVDFWDNFDSDELCDLAVCPFCPVRCLDFHPSDLYDSVSYFVYDLHDTLRAHTEYLTSMKVISVPREVEMQRQRVVYEAFSANTVPMLLEAMLRQVEENLKESEDVISGNIATQLSKEPSNDGSKSPQLSTSNVAAAAATASAAAAATAPKHPRNLDHYLREQTHRANDVDDECRRLGSTSTSPQLRKPSTLPEAQAATATSLSKANSSAFARLTAKLRLLNLKYELISRANAGASASSAGSPEPELILHGDSLRLNACRANDESETEPEVEEVPNATPTRSEAQPEWKLSSFRASLPTELEEPRIAAAWREGLERRGEVENCNMHLPGIFECCEKEGIDRSRAKHLLNLLGFRKMLESYYPNSTSLTSSLTKVNINESLNERKTEFRYNRKTGSLLQDVIKQRSNLELQAKRKIVEEMKIISNDTVTTTNLSENNSRSLQIQDASKITNYILVNFSSEVGKVYEKQQRNIIFEELPEEPSTENEKRKFSLNANPEQMRIMQKFEKQHVTNTRTENAQEKENVKSGIATNFTFSATNSDRRCPSALSINATTSSSVMPQSQRPGRLGTSSDRLPATPEASARLSSLNPSVSSAGLRVLRSFERCSALFGLIDATAALQQQQQQCPMALEEFEDVELLARPAFLQIVRDCFQEYEEATAVARHFAPTNSILLLFCDEPPSPGGKATKRRRTCVLPTAVCLRDFYDYVAGEERDWLEERRRRRHRSVGSLRERWREKVLGGGEEGEETGMGMVFRDEDFVLPGSLKACDLQEMRGKDEGAGDREEGIAVKSEAEENVKTRKAISKLKNPNATIPSSSSKPILKNHSSEKRLSALRRKSSELHPSASRASPITAEQAEPFVFIGYDLGRRRVQVTNLSRSWVSALDGTRLRLVRESWLLAGAKMPSNTSIGLTMTGNGGGSYSLRCHEVEGQEARSLFHLAMGNGVIAAFAREPRVAENTGPHELLYEIQISLPSGLIMKPVEYPDADYPFYILQYYMSTRHRCKNIKDEIHRKYLHNGDVVKFLNDGSIIVLRPNGTVITVVNYGKGDGESRLVSEVGDGVSMENIGISKETSRLLHQSSSETLCSSPVASLHYIVLELDGRRYEVQLQPQPQLDGSGSCFKHRELDRLRASVAEDYSPLERFVRRADGTDALFNADGDLIVSFPDGTRTLTSCIVEAEPVHCDWSPRELELYFGEQQQPEGFVSVLTCSRVEHPSYATVAHDSDSLCSLTICGGWRVDLGPRGLGRFVCCEDRVGVELSSNSVSFDHFTCNSDCSAPPISRATFHLVVDPSTILAPEDRRLLTFRDDASCLTVMGDEDASFIVSCSSGGEKGENGRKTGCRIFAVDRQGEAYEYHHLSAWREYEKRLMAEQEAAGLICQPVDGRPGMEYRLALVPVKIGGNWLLDYTIPKAKPSSKHRVTMYGSADDEYDEPLKASVSSVPVQRFLMARLLEGIEGRDDGGGCGCEPGDAENSLISMQKALLRYWHEVATGVRKSGDNDDEESEASTVLMRECRGDIESWMRDVAAGRARTIDREIYEAGRQHLRKMKVQRDEERTRQMIDRCYQRKTTPDECLWLR